MEEFSKLLCVSEMLVSASTTEKTLPIFQRQALSWPLAALRLFVTTITKHPRFSLSDYRLHLLPIKNSQTLIPSIAHSLHFCPGTEVCQALQVMCHFNKFYSSTKYYIDVIVTFRSAHLET